MYPPLPVSVCFLGAYIKMEDAKLPSSEQDNNVIGTVGVFYGSLGAYKGVNEKEDV